MPGIGRSRRRILHANLRARVSREERRAEIERLARDSADCFGAAFIEFLAGRPRCPRTEIRERVRVVGDEHFAAARARGRGVFLLSAHFGGWELGAIRAGLIGEPIAPVVRPLDNPLLEKELARRRTRFGNRLIAKRDAAREILRTLRDERDGRDPDRPERPAAARASSCRSSAGSPRRRPPLALFQLKTDAAVVPVFVWPEGGGRYRLELERPDPRRRVPLRATPTATRPSAARPRATWRSPRPSIRRKPDGLALDARPVEDAAGDER